MALNEYDQIVKTGNVPNSNPAQDEVLNPPENDNDLDYIDSAVKELAKQYNLHEENKKEDIFSLSQDEAMELKRLSNESLYDVDVVADNKDDIKQEIKRNKYDLKDLREKSPDVYRYSMQGKNLAAVRDDLGFLSKYEEASRSFAKKKEDSLYNFDITPDELKEEMGKTYAGGLINRVDFGLTDLAENAVAALAVQGRLSPEESAEYLRSTKAYREEIQKYQPEIDKLFRAKWSSEFKDIPKAWDEAKQSYKEFSTDNFFSGLGRLFSSSGTLGAEFIEFLAAAPLNPEGFSYLMAEQVPNMFPSLATGTAAAVASSSLAPISAATGPLAPAVQGFFSAAAFAGGSFVPTAAIEYGAHAKNKIFENLPENYSDDDLISLLRDQSKLSSIHDEGVKRGLTVAGTEGLATLVGAGLFSKLIKGKGLMRNAARGSVRALTEGVGEAAGEVTGAISVGESANPEEVLQSFVIGSVFGIPEVFAQDAGARSISTDQFMTDASSAVRDLSDSLGLKSRLSTSRNAIKDSSLFQKGRDVIEEIDSEINGTSNENVVYYQSEDIDKIAKEGNITTEEALDLLGVGVDEYRKSAQTKESIEAKKVKLDLMESDAVFNAATNHARNEPGSANLAESTEAIAGITAAAPEVVKQYEEQKRITQEAKKKELEVKKSIMRQFKSQGLRSDEGLLLFEFLKTMGERSGLGINELYKSYGVEIKNEIAPLKIKWTPEDIADIQNNPAVSTARAQGFDTTQVAYVGKSPLGTQVNADRVIKDSTAAFVKFENIALNESAVTPELIEAIQAKHPDDTELGSIVLGENPTVGDVYNFVANKYSPNEALVLFAEAGFDGYSATIEGTPSTIALNGSSIKYVEDVLGSSEVKKDLPEARGATKFKEGDSYKKVIEIYKDADLSTVIHEMGHYFLETMGNLSSRNDVSQEIKDDFNSILEYLGVTKVEDLKTEQHELFAKTFEQYVFEGKPPSEKLQGTFNSYAQYLKGVYSTTKGLDVPINNEIRTALDRMMAVDEAIESATFVNDSDRILGDYKQWMNEADAAAFEKAKGDAQQFVREKLYRKFMRDTIVEKNKKLKSIREEVTKTIESDPVYSLIDYMKGTEGKGEVKFSKDWIKENMPSGSLSKLRGLYSENGTDPDIIAADLNLGSGRELLDGIIKSPSKKEMIEIAAQAELEARHPDLANLNSLAADATDAYISENLSKVLEQEIKFMASNEYATFRKVIRRTQRQPISLVKARSKAQALVDTGISSKDTPNKYFVAARKASNEAMDLALKGDIDAAIAKKETQMINLEAYRIAKKNKLQRDRFFKLAKKINAVTETKLEKLNRDSDLVLAAKALMARFGLPGRIRDVSELIKPIGKYSEEKIKSIAARISGLNALEKDINSLTNAEFEEFSAVVETLWDESLEINKVQIGREKFEIAKIKQEAIDSLSPFINGKRTWQGVTRKYPFLKVLNSKLMSLIRLEYHVEAITDGDLDHFLNKRLFRPVEEINQKIRSETLKYSERFQQIAKKNKIKIEGKEIDASSFFGLDAEGSPVSFTDEQVVGMLLHMGNESNYKKLIVGNKLGSENADGSLNDTQFKKFINKMIQDGVLEKRHFDFAQDVRNLFASMTPDVQKAWKKRTGAYFREIEAREVETPFGNYKGGYAPLTIDFDALSKLKEKVDLEQLKVDNASYSMPILKGGGMGRSRQNVYLPIDLTLGRYQSSIREFVRYVNSTPLTDIAKYIQSEEVVNSINSINPDFYEKVVVPYIKRVDQQRTTVDIVSPDTRKLLAGMSSLQTRASAGIMFLNAQNVLEMFGDLGQATVYVDKGQLAKAGTSLLKDKANMTELIVNSSPYMKLRLERDANAVNEQTGRLIGKESTLEKLNDFSRDHAFIGQRLVDGMLSRSVWLAKYTEEINKNPQIKISDAVFKADQAVRLSFGDNRPSDKSSFEGNIFGKLTQVFYSWSNQKFNVLLAKGGQIARSNEPARVKALKASVLGVQTLIIPVAFSQAIRALLQGEAYDEDDDGAFLDDFAKNTARDTMSLSIRGVPFASEIAEKMVINKIIPERQFYGSKVTGLNAVDLYVSALDRASSGLGNFFIKGEKPGHAAYDTIVLMNLLLGVNAVPFGKGLKYWDEVNEGKSNADDLTDIVRGVTTGRARD